MLNSVFAEGYRYIRYNYILLKELVHHIPEENVVVMFSGIRRQLLDGGKSLTVTRPQEVDFPLFQRAREIWRENQPNLNLLVRAMEAAGLRVHVHEKRYPVKLSKHQWLTMVSNKFWSTFSLCSEEELRSGLIELEEQFKDAEDLEFVDKLLFIEAIK